jgi:hypothetical protein
MRTLHITNGDSAAAGIRQATRDETLPWRDVLHDGPVPDVDDAALRSIRAEFIAGRGWGSRDAVLADFESRDARTRDAAGAQPIVLWFEPDLYDQLQLLQVLDCLARCGAAAGSAGVSLIAPPHHLGDRTVEQLESLLGTARLVTPHEFDAGRQAWAAFRAPTPERWQSFGFSDGPLPYLAGAVRRHLEEYPDVTTGLARTEAELLAILAHAPTAMAAAFAKIQEGEEWTWLGDASFADIVRELANEPYPLVGVEPELGAALGRREPIDRALWNEKLKLTTYGRAALAGDSDRIALRGIDRWLGGVHLTDDDVWRWTGEHLTHGG